MNLFQTLDLYTDSYLLIASILAFAVFIIFFAIRFKHLKEHLKLEKRTLMLLSVIFIIAFLLRLLISPHHHLMYMDEPNYMYAAKNIAQDFSLNVYSKSVGWPILLSPVFLIGQSSALTILFTSIIGSLSVFPIFFLTRYVTKKESIAVLASILLMIFPSHIRWSTTAETNVPALFFLITAIFLSLIYLKEDRSFYLAISSITLASLFRPEYYLLFPLFVIGLFIYKKRINFTHLLAAFIIILAIPNLIHLLEFQTSSNWSLSETGEYAPNIGLSNLIRNTITSFTKIFSYSYTILLFIPLFIIGLKDNDKEKSFLLTWIILLFIFIYSLWPQRIDASDSPRIFLAFSPFLFIFISIGLKKITKVSFLQSSIILILLLTPAIMASDQLNSDPSRKLETIIPEIVEKDIENCTIIANHPIIFRATTDLDVINTISFLNRPKKEDCLLFYEDFFCLESDDKGSFERCNAMKEYYGKAYKSYSLDKKTFTFYIIN